MGKDSRLIELEAFIYPMGVVSAQVEHNEWWWSLCQLLWLCIIPDILASWACTNN